MLLVGGVLLGENINLNGNGILICANLTISDLLVTACYFWVMRNLQKEMKKFCEDSIQSELSLVKTQTYLIGAIMVLQTVNSLCVLIYLIYERTKVETECETVIFNAIVYG